MKILNNEIVIHRGESFTIDRCLENKDGSPYIISSELANPYFLITVSSSKYDQNNRYVKNYWLNLSNFPRFFSTNPVDLSSIKTSPNGSISKYDDFPDGLLEGYIGGLYVKFDSANDCVVYKQLANGKKEYRYYDESKGWLIYKCRLIKHFFPEDSKKLTSQSYTYSINLVSGPKVDGEKPLSKFDVNLTILPPTKLSVLSNLQGE